MRQRMERPFRNKWLTLISMCAICLCLLVGGYMLYQRSIEDAVSGTTISYMDQMANHDIRNVGSQIDSRLDYLHSLGNRLQLVHEDEQVDIPYLLSVTHRRPNSTSCTSSQPRVPFTTAPTWLLSWRSFPGRIIIRRRPGILSHGLPSTNGKRGGSTCFMESSWTGRFPTAASRLRGLWGWFPWRS